MTPSKKRFETTGLIFLQAATLLETSVEKILSRSGSGPNYAAMRELLKAQAGGSRLLACTDSLPPEKND
jgi:hypothetical protein